MAAGTGLLDEAGNASMATAVMMSHHGLRRDMARFALALQAGASDGFADLEALRAEWLSYRNKLHGHHEAEDTSLLPHLRSQEPGLAPVIERLMADHRRIDPLLARGDRAFAELPETASALRVVTELRDLLEAHLTTEEAEVIPFLRDARQFPPAGGEAELDMYAEGFAWASHGVADDVLERMDAMLPESLRARLPAARAAFRAKYEKLWGTLPPGAARTSVPDV